jgi:hypothetical protein
LWRGPDSSPLPWRGGRMGRRQAQIRFGNASTA